MDVKRKSAAAVCPPRSDPTVNQFLRPMATRTGEPLDSCRPGSIFPRRGVVIVEIDVPRRWLRRSKRGLWYCPRDIPPERIRGVVTFAALARSPVSGDAA